MQWANDFEWVKNFHSERGSFSFILWERNLLTSFNFFSTFHHLFFFLYESFIFFSNQQVYKNLTCWIHALILLLFNLRTMSHIPIYSLIHFLNVKKFIHLNIKVLVGVKKPCFKNYTFLWFSFPLIHWFSLVQECQ